MFSLAEENTTWALREKLPTKTGILVIIASEELIPEIRNTIVMSLPEGSAFKGDGWVLPEGEKIWLRSFEDKIPNFPYDLWVCTGGEIIPQEQALRIAAWRKQDAS